MRNRPGYCALLAILALWIAPPAMGLNVVSLTVSTPEVFVGDEVNVKLEIAFDEATVGGGVDVEIIGGEAAFISFAFGGSLGDDPLFRSSPPNGTDVSPLVVAFGSFDTLIGDKVVGTFKFMALAPGELRLVVSSNPNPFGPFADGDGNELDVSHVGASLQIVEAPKPACSNGQDDDDDGLVDFPLDSGCVSPLDEDETDAPKPACSNEVDDDGDALIDFPSDPGCGSVFDDNEVDAPLPACSNGIDDDEDGLVDHPMDPGCRDGADQSEINAPLPGCSNGVDDDGDSFIDFPADDGCTSALDSNETTAVGASANNTGPSVSSKGRFVAFVSDDSSVLEDDTNERQDVFFRDRKGKLGARKMSGGYSGEADGDASRPVVSANGRYVAFESLATNMIPEDDNAAADVFLRDVKTGGVELVSVAATETGLADGDSGSPAISGSGRYVAFSSVASNLIEDDENALSDVFLYDRRGGRVRRASLRPDGGEGDGESREPAISATGRFVAFVSSATNLVDDDGNSRADIFVWDRKTGVIERVSVAGDGSEANGDSSGPALSANGRFVAFTSDATNLTAGDANEHADVFVHDRKKRTTERVSVSSEEVEADNVSYGVSISGNGRVVAFSSLASNLVSEDTNAVSDVFVRDRKDGTTERIESGVGSQGDADTQGASVSGNGRVLAVESWADSFDDLPDQASDVFAIENKSGAGWSLWGPVGLD